jgi:spore maturation protein CgeB
VRFLIVDTDYPWFLDWLYAQHPGLEKESYDKQIQVRGESLFACGLSYSSNLRKLGHQAHQIFFNNEHLQTAWAREHGLKINTRWQFRMRRGLVPWLSRLNDPDWLYDILTAQIKHYKPDVLLNNYMRLSTAYFRRMKPYLRLLVGSHGSPLPEDRDFGVYDLILSVVENFVDHFRREGGNSELLRLAFDPAVLERLNGTEGSIPVSFVGQLSRQHASRQRWLEHLSQRIPLQVWAPSTDDLRDDSPVIRHHRGAAWGMEMYGILHESQITLNHHIDVAEAYAGNARLFEATGVGTLLVTDWKQNLHEMFEPGKEVVCYRTAEECAEMIQYYLEHKEEREAIARAGQQRTLRDHTFYNRMQEFADIVRKQL